MGSGGGASGWGREVVHQVGSCPKLTRTCPEAVPELFLRGSEGFSHDLSMQFQVDFYAFCVADVRLGGASSKGERRGEGSVEWGRMREQTKRKFDAKKEMEQVGGEGRKEKIGKIVLVKKSKKENSVGSSGR